MPPRPRFCSKEEPTPNEKDDDRTPLEAASGNPKITRLLKRYGAR